MHVPAAVLDAVDAAVLLLWRELTAVRAGRAGQFDKMVEGDRHGKLALVGPGFQRTPAVSNVISARRIEAIVSISVCYLMIRH